MFKIGSVYVVGPHKNWLFDYITEGIKDYRYNRGVFLKEELVLYLSKYSIDSIFAHRVFRINTNQFIRIASRTMEAVAESL